MALPHCDLESLYRYKDINLVEQMKNPNPEVLDVVQFMGSKVEPILYKYHKHNWFKKLTWQPFANEKLLLRIKGALYVPVDENGIILVGGSPFQGIQTKASYAEGRAKGMNMPNELRFQHFLKTKTPISNLYDLGFFHAGVQLYGEPDMLPEQIFVNPTAASQIDLQE